MVIVSGLAPGLRGSFEYRMVSDSLRWEPLRSAKEGRPLRPVATHRQSELVPVERIARGRSRVAY